MWVMATVASRFISMLAIGLPTMLLAPTTTTFWPAMGMLLYSSMHNTPYGVQGGNTVSPATNAPTLYRLKPSTSLVTAMASSIARASKCAGNGSCTRMP